MIRFRNFLPLVVAALIGTASSAEAGFQVTFQAGASSATIQDGGPGDADPTSGSIGVIGQTVGGYTFDFTLTRTNTPGGALAFINHGTNSISGSVATTIQIIASANGFTAPTGPLTAISGSTDQFLDPTPSAQTADVSYSAYLDEGNALASSVPAGTLIGSDGPKTITGSAGNATLSDTRFISATAPYALTLQLQAVLNNSGANYIDLDGTLSVTPVPAPAGLALALAGMPVLGLGVWLRRRVPAVA